MYLAAATTNLPATRPPGQGAMAQEKFRQAMTQRTPIERAMPYIVGISGMLTIATLVLSLYDRAEKSKRAKK